MKVICEKCQAKYSIKDERVQGRILKIRCRKCGALIEVADPVRTSVPPAAVNRDAATPSASTGSPLADRFAQSFRGGKGTPSPAPNGGDLSEAIHSALPTPRSGPDAEVWYAAMDGQPVGPVSARKVASYRQQRRVTDQTLVWKEGLVDWMPLGECEILVDLLEEVRRDTTALPAGPSLPPPSPEAAQLPTLWPPAAAEPTAHNHLPSIAPPAPTGSGRNWKILAAVSFFVASGAILALVIFLGKNKPETIIKEKIVEKTQVVYRDRPLGTVETETAGAEADNGASASTRTRTAARPAATGGTAQETSEQRRRRLMEELAAGRGTSSAASSGQSLSPRQMSAVVSKNSSSLQLCYERAMKAGTAPTDRDLKVLFDVTVGTSGMVKTVSLSGAGAGYPSMAKCMEGSVRQWMFPASGGTSSVQFPIVFTPAR